MTNQLLSQWHWNQILVLLAHQGSVSPQWVFQIQPYHRWRLYQPPLESQLLGKLHLMGGNEYVEKFGPISMHHNITFD